MKQYFWILSFSILLITNIGCQQTDADSRQSRDSRAEATNEITSQEDILSSPTKTIAKDEGRELSATVKAPQEPTTTASDPSSLSTESSQADAPSSEPTPSSSNLSSAGSSLTASVSGLEGLVADLGGRTTATEIYIDLPTDVLFDFDSATLRPDAFPSLEKLARIVNSSEGTVQVKGHTDAIGDETYNLQLSERRAQAVAQWLTDQDITASRLQAIGQGETQPVAQNTQPDGSDNPEGRAKNRRVEVIIPKS